MPPTGPLNNEEIAKLEKWIALGAPYPATATPSSNFDLITRRNKHWAWQPIKPAKLPPDKPTEKAAPETLLRRITFDLTGLPPTPEEIRESAPYEKVVDRLLASPKFGERMARRWMDIIRYSESHGSEGDPDTPLAWRYRDYLIRAFNSDLPFNQFIREHVAGDLLKNPRLINGQNESVLATAFWRFGEMGHDNCNQFREIRTDVVDNQIDTDIYTIEIHEVDPRLRVLTTTSTIQLPPPRS